jgi:REP element-mobilizing transposase RayT
MEIGNEPLLLDSAGAELIGNAINKQAQKLWIRVVVGNILPDHAHIIIENNDTSIPEIAQRLKGYSSYLYNRTFRHSGPVWVVWYSDTYLDNKKHLENAVEYVKNNHIKHKAKSYYLWWESL